MAKVIHDALQSNLYDHYDSALNWSADLDVYTLNKTIKYIRIIWNYAVGDHGQTPTPDLTRGDAAHAESLVNRALTTVDTVKIDVKHLRDAEGC